MELLKLRRFFCDLVYLRDKDKNSIEFSAIKIGRVSITMPCETHFEKSIDPC